MTDDPGVPKTWRRAAFGDLLTPKYGKAIEKARRAKSGAFPVVGSAGVMAYCDDALSPGATIVLGRKGNIADVHRFPGGCWPIDTTYFCSPPAELDLGFTYWMLLAADLGRLDSSTTMPSLRREDLERVPVVVPPLEEQHAIVEILEDHLSRLDAAVAGVAAVRAKAEVLRRGLLRDAFTGALTGRHQTGPEAPHGWVVRSLDEINEPSRPICYGILMPGPDIPDGIPYVKVRNIKGGRVLLDGVHRTTPEIESKYSRSRLRTGDLLVSIRGTYGRTATVPRELDGGNITQDTARVAPVGVDPSYVLRFLDSPEAQSYFKTVARGVAVKGVNIGDLRKLPVPVPPGDEQRVICDTLDEQLPRIDAVLAATAVAETRAKALRRSLLHAAFRGDLTREWRERHG